MEQSQHKHNLMIYVVIGIAVLLVIVLLARGSGSGAVVAGPSPQAVTAAANASAAEQASANNAVTLKAQIAAQQKVALVQAADQMKVGLAEIRATTEQAKISATSTDQVAKLQYGKVVNQNSLSRIVQAILANLNFGGYGPVQMYPAGAGFATGSGSVYGVPPTGTYGPPPGSYGAPPPWWSQLWGGWGTMGGGANAWSGYGP